MAEIKAVFFDQDGVIIDTERDGHRVSFNMTFKEFGFTDEWSVEYYHELLQIAGGKERMKHHWKTKGLSANLYRKRKSTSWSRTCTSARRPSSSI